MGERRIEGVGFGGNIFKKWIEGLGFGGRVSGFGSGVDRLSGRGAARAEDAQGTPTQSHISTSILVYQD